jgi:hypothetical protein
LASRSACANRPPPNQLLRYLAVSTIIVVAAFVVVGVYWNRENLAIRIKSVFVKTPPKAAQTPPPSKRAESSFTGEAAWALSALPECFMQTERASGPLNYVLSQLPPSAAMVRPGSTIDVADCHLAIQGASVLVTRGSDRLRIPGPARVYRAPGSLALLRGADNGYELRIYRTQQ